MTDPERRFVVGWTCYNDVVNVNNSAINAVVLVLLAMVQLTPIAFAMSLALTKTSPVRGSDVI